MVYIFFFANFGKRKAKNCAYCFANKCANCGPVGGAKILEDRNCIFSILYYTQSSWFSIGDAQ